MAELFAIYKAIEYVTDFGDRNTVFDIVSDSLSALQAIVSLNENRVFITTIRNKINNFGIRLFWTKAHVCDQGNEAADELAKISTSKCVDHEFCLTKVQLRKILDSKYNNIWNERWHNSMKGIITKKYIKDVSEIKIYSNFYINQVVTGH